MNHIKLLVLIINTLFLQSIKALMLCKLPSSSFSYYGSLIYSDDSMIVYNKAANVLSVPGLYGKNNLATEVARLYNIDRVDQMIVHRLDYATSGLIVFARNYDSLKYLHEQFRKKKVKKIYSSIVAVNGKEKAIKLEKDDDDEYMRNKNLPRLSALEGEIKLPIVRDKKRGAPYHCAIDETGKAKLAHTEWKVKQISSHSGHTLAQLDMEPRTGRTHQLRIHAAATNMPILGDNFYAPSHIQELAPRLLLHARDLKLLSPITGKPMQFHAEVPFKLI